MINAMKQKLLTGQARAGYRPRHGLAHDSGHCGPRRLRLRAGGLPTRRMGRCPGAGCVSHDLARKRHSGGSRAAERLLRASAGCSTGRARHRRADGQYGRRGPRRRLRHALPAHGGRSYAGSLAVHYGTDYDTWADRELFLAVQIETAQAAEHADEIMAVEGVDGCWIGPMDLARSLGVGVGTPAHQEALLNVLNACRKTGKIPGIYTPNAATARLRIEQGFRFVTAADDGGLVADGAQEVLRQLGRAS